MHYFTYIIRLINSDKYYVWRHSTKLESEKSKYKGSGKWVRSIKDKNLLEREILQFFENEECLIEGERRLLKEHLGKPGCMNFNENPVGFSSINNPSKRPEERIRRSERSKGKNNPMYGRKFSENELKRRSDQMKLYNPARDDQKVKDKISKNLIGKNKGKLRSQELKQFFSEQRKQKWADGSLKGMTGKNHSEETKNKLKNNPNNKKPKQIIVCPHCNKEGGKPVMIRFHFDNCKSLV